jgi:DNA-binding GntR family transcriptional regulator
MKRLALFLLLTPIFAHAQSPVSDRWALLYDNPKANEKTYIDTQTITFNDYFEGVEKVYLIWVRTYHNISIGKYDDYEDQHIAISLSTSQFELKSVSKHKDGNIINEVPVNHLRWLDIPPESNGELLLSYCKKLNK